LALQPDYQSVAGALDKLGAGKDWMRSFSRPDEDTQTVYEMLRTNQLDKTSSIYAQLLINFFGDKVKQVDGSKFPDFDNFRPYLGATGLYCVQEEEGWFMVGCSLHKK